MNNVTLIGRVTEDIELRTTTNGTSVVNFTLAARRNKEETDFIDCKAWKGTADYLSTYIHKGNRIAITGRLEQERWEKDGKKYSKVLVVVNEVTPAEYSDKKPSQDEPQEQRKPTPYDFEHNPDFNPEDYFVADGSGCPF